ncbi:gcn5-related n-acetyltransferase [Alternaria alternata]|nr:gcn5-related n-acetyltransferase [Alternaria alternata]
MGAVAEGGWAAAWAGAVGRATCALEAVCSVKGLRYAIGDMRRIRTRCRYAGGRGVNWPSSWREWRFASNASSVVRTRPITRLA